MDLKEDFKALAKDTENQIQQILKNAKLDYENNLNSLTDNLVTSIWDVNLKAVEKYKIEIENNIINWFMRLYSKLKLAVTITNFNKDLVLEKLKQVEFERKNYLTMLEAQNVGKSAIYIFKEGDKIQLLPCKIIYESSINGKINTITISDGNEYVLDQNRYIHVWSFKLVNSDLYFSTWWTSLDGVPLTNELIDSLYKQFDLKNQVDPQILYSNVNNIVCIVKLSNNYLDQPTCINVQNKIIQAANYDAVLTNLPNWEMGVFTRVSSSITDALKEKTDMNDLMNAKTIELDWQGNESTELGVTEIAKFLQPNSIQQTTLNSYKEIMHQIYQTLGIPIFDDNYSIQQISDEVINQQFLVSSQLEQNRQMHEHYLVNLIKNFIIVGKKEGFTDFNSVNETTLVVDVKLELPIVQKTTKEEVNNEG